MRAIPTAETRDVDTRMKHRWTGGLALATAFMLGACAPTQQGADESESPAIENVAPTRTAEPTESAEPGESAEPSEGAEASEDAEPTPDDYEY